MLINITLLIAFLLILILAISKWKVHPFIALLLVGIALGLSMGMGGPKTVEVLLTGFSETLKWIAVIIILGAFIGEVLQETGGALRISNAIVKRLGERKLPWAMGLTGYIVSIPVFVDVAYILLQPVTESLAVKSKKPVLYLGLSLAAGLTVAHTLIPPTPGPMAVAALLEVDMGRMLAINLIVAACAMVGGILFTIYFVKDQWLDYDRKIAQELEIEKEESTVKPKQHFLVDILPIVIPIILIGIGSFIDLDKSTFIGKILGFVSIPIIAVLVGALVAVFQVKSSDKKSTINRLVEQAILKSALVIMITGAGGAFGYIIRESGVQNQIVDVFSTLPFLGILLPFLVAAILTTSTGSITVSLVGTASMLGPMIDSLPVSPEITAALIGCGAFCVFHANSSFFWLLNRLHEVPPKILYKTFTVQSLVMGLSGLLAVLLLNLLGV